MSLRENSQNFRGNPDKKVDCFVAKIVNAPRNDAFTLAEVLITLVIIGIIAAITVPTLITKYQKEQTVTRLKKAYSALAQTTQRAIADNGPMNTWKYVSDEDRDTLKFVQTYIIPYMNVMDKCINGNNIRTTGICSFKYRGLNSSSNEITVPNSNPRFVLQDGTFFYWSCINDIVNGHGNLCQVSIDINGAKKPNRQGKDIFNFFYYISPGTSSVSKKYNGKFEPTAVYWSRGSLLATGNGSCNKNSDNSGMHCAAVIMKDSWQIKDDYPW